MACQTLAALYGPAGIQRWRWNPVSMPDQSSAASEHAIMQQITAPLADLPDDPVAAAANPDFPVVLRGYDRVAVETYVNQITQLVAELYATRSPEGAIRRALERVGGEVSAILQRAHETADQITTQSRAEAEERVIQARQEADARERSSRERAREAEQQAQRRMQDLDAEVDRIWAERDRIVGDVRRLAEELATLGGAAATRFPAEPSEEGGTVGDEVADESLSDEEFGPMVAEERAVDEVGVAADEPVAGDDESTEMTEPFAAPESESFRAAQAASFEAEEAEPFTVPEAEPFAAPPPEPYPAPPPFVEEYVGKAQPIKKKRKPEQEPEEAAEAPGAEESLGAQDAEALAAAETAQLPVEAAADAPIAGDQAPADQPTLAHESLGRPLSSEPRLIDLMHLGRERVIGCWQVGDVLVDPGPSTCLETLLGALGDQRPRALLLTHIHLDHAGASGSLVERWPDLEVYVHERGAPHLMEPSKLLESARRLYGDDMERLWGEIRPLPAQNVRLLRGGERVLGGAFEVVYTPGHASHHVSYLEGTMAFVGDTAGVRITSETLTIPPTPPPDIDVEAWHQSINRVLAWKPTRLAMTHFGSTDDVPEQLNELSERLDNWAALARTEDQEMFIATIREEIERNAGDELLPAYAQAAPPEQVYAGLKRYWEKRAETETSASSAPAEASTHAGRFLRPGGG